MRNRYKKTKHYPDVASAIARNYNKLRAICHKQHGCYESRSYEDIFQDTILFVIQDKESLKCNTDESLVEHFVHRYKMIEYQTIHDSYNIKTIPYAEHLQAKEEE